MAILATPSVFRLEFAWIAFEVIGVSAGLWLMLDIPSRESGGLVLLLVCATSFVLRRRQKFVGT